MEINFMLKDEIMLKYAFLPKANSLWDIQQDRHSSLTRAGQA